MKPLDQSAGGWFHRGAELYGLGMSSSRSTILIFACCPPGSTAERMIPCIEPGSNPVVAGLSGLRAARWLILLCLLRAPAAGAFHSGAQFDDPPGKAAAAACFSPAPQRARLGLQRLSHPARRQDSREPHHHPAGLVQSGTYSPGVAYQLNLALAGEHRGLSSGDRTSTASPCSSATDRGRPAGTISGYAPEEIYQPTKPRSPAPARRSVPPRGPLPDRAQGWHRSRHAVPGDGRRQMAPTAHPPSLRPILRR